MLRLLPHPELAGISNSFWVVAKWKKYQHLPKIRKQSAKQLQFFLQLPAISTWVYLNSELLSLYTLFPPSSSPPTSSLSSLSSKSLPHTLPILLQTFETLYLITITVIVKVLNKPLHSAYHSLTSTDREPGPNITAVSWTSSLGS